MLPFSAEQFFALFERYNAAIWPYQILAYALGIAMAGWVIAGQRWGWTAAAILLGVFWLWNGVVYHLMYFAPLNPAAYGFAILFIVQGLAFIGSGLRQNNQTIIVASGICTSIACVLILFALVIYSLVGYFIGHGWPRLPIFGVAPCPTTIFTLGVLMLARPIVSPWLAVIPIAWALIGSTAAILLGVWEDLGLLLSVIAFLACRLSRLQSCARQA